MRTGKTLGLVFLSFVLIIFGCGGECKQDGDCSSKQCFEVTCVNKVCDYFPEPNCCGNEKCDSSENKCTCQKDCGVCDGKSDEYKFLTNFCNTEQECVFGVDEKAVTTASLNSGALKEPAGTFEIDSTVNQPFNVKKDQVQIQITLKEIDQDASNIQITKIELIGENSKKQKVTLGEKETSRPMWVSGDLVKENLILNPQASDQESELKNAQITVTYTYQDAYKGSSVDRQDSFTFKYPSLAFVYVQPDTAVSCPPESEWDDDNSGTEDICSASTKYFVQHNPIPRACGNYKCDDNETRCDCPVDCGPCSGNVGSYMALECNSQRTCVSILRRDVTFTPGTIFHEHRGSGFKIITKVTLDNPFDLKESVIVVDLELTEVDTTKTGDVVVTDVRVLEGTSVVLEKKLNQKLSSSTTSFTQKTSYLMDEFEDEATLSTKVWYEYQAKSTSGGEVKITDKFNNYQVALGKIMLLSPGTKYNE